MIRRVEMPHNAINKRILDDINSLDTNKDIKEFLEEILSIELENIDKDKSQYIERYKEKLNEIFF